MAWAFATVIYRDEKLFAALAGAAERRLIVFTPQNVANTAWAFATVRYRNEKLFADLSSTAKQRLSEFNSQALANTAWAFATGNNKGEKRIPQEVANMAWALTRVHY